jgi:transposase
MDLVVIGMDPHKRSVTIEARDTREVLRATGTFPTSTAGYRAMVSLARQWPRRVWAVEGAQGVGRPIAQRLLASGEQVLDVPAKLAARARVFDTGQGPQDRRHRRAFHRAGGVAGQGAAGGAGR